MRTNYQTLLIQRDGGVLTITMNRPEVLNAFNDVMLEELTEAVEAERIGLVNKCVPLAGFETAVTAFAQRLANGPTRTYALIKKQIYTSAEADFQTALQLEGALQDIAFETEDHKNAIMAFLQKRKPEYKGR